MIVTFPGKLQGAQPEAENQRSITSPPINTHTAMQRGFRLPVRWLFLFGSPLGLAGGGPMAQGRAQPRSRLGAGGRMGPLLLPVYMAKLAVPS